MARDLLEYSSTLAELAADLPGLIHPVMDRVAELVRSEATENLSGRVLESRSGDLLSTLRVETEQGAQGARVAVSAGDSVTRYARIHEFGGTILPTGGEYLHFLGRRGWARVRQVNIPARPYLRPALEEGAEALPDMLHDRFVELIQGGA